MNHSVIGWTDTYITKLPKTAFTEERKKAFIERVRQRKYNFTYDNYQFLSFCCPVFEDKTICVLNKKQFDDVMSEAWKNMPLGQRLMPMDLITIPVKNEILFEKEKYSNKEDNNNV